MKFTVIVLVLLIAAAVPLLYARASEDDLAKLKPGMTKEQVREVMGPPDSQSEEPSDGLCTRWTYRNVGRYRTVALWFSCKDQKLAVIDKTE